MANWDFSNINRTRKRELHEPYGYSKNVGDMVDAERQEGNKRDILEKKIWSFSISGAS